MFSDDSCAASFSTSDLSSIYLPQTLTNVRMTLITDAHSSVTTSSEGTTAPVAMVTTWTRTNTLALVQKICVIINGAQINETNKGGRNQTET